MKKFWKKTEGFTLVELVVVIAILGILAGVGTVGYSGYISKANMAADQQLLNGVKNAIQLALITDGSECQIGVGIEIDETGADFAGNADDTSKQFLDDAMVAAYGADWKNLKLKYTEWTGTAGANQDLVNDGPFDVDETITVLGDLTADLAASGALVNLDNSGLGNYLRNNGLAVPGASATDAEKTAAANAAVLYVAQSMNGKEDTVTSTIDTMVTGIAAGTPNALATGISNLSNEIGKLPAYAAVYACLEGYAQHTGNQEIKDALHGANAGQTIENESTLMDAINRALTVAATDDMAGMTDYFNKEVDGETESEKAMKAYVALMGTVNKYEDAILQDVGNSDCFTSGGTAQGLVSSWLAMGDGVSVVVTNAEKASVAILADLDA